MGQIDKCPVIIVYQWVEWRIFTMGILTRFTDIMKSNINALLDKCEDPAKMIDQTLRDLREDLAEVKKETAKKENA